MRLLPRAGALLFVFAATLAFAEAPARHTVTADGHPIAVWEKSAANAREAILLVHGRTWSAIPDFDLQVDGEELSLMDGLVGHGYAVYAIDLRGYGETPRDDSGWLTPDRAAADVAIVLGWIDGRGSWRKRPHLFGWSMGSMISQLVAQRHPERLASLTLFGYPRDPDAVSPADGPDTESTMEPQRLENTAEAAASDFITPGSISAAAVDAYVALALLSDPVKTDIRGLDQYHALDPKKVRVPTLVLQGEHDPIAPTEYQAKLFTRLGTAHRQWVVVPGGDHAAHLEKSRDYFIHALVSFLESVEKGSNQFFAGDAADDLQLRRIREKLVRPLF